MGHFMSNFSTFIVAIIVAFACCWEVGMLSVLVVPMLLMVGATYAKMMIDMSLERISFVSEATTVVQQVPAHYSFRLHWCPVCSILPLPIPKAVLRQDGLTGGGWLARRRRSRRERGVRLRRRFLQETEGARRWACCLRRSPL